MIYDNGRIKQKRGDVKMEFAKFERLPEGYGYELTNGLGHRYNVKLIKPGGEKTWLSGPDDRPTGFAGLPGLTFRIGDVRETLIKEKLGEGEEYYWHVYGCDERTNKYLNACEKNIGLIGRSEDETLTIDDTWQLILTGALNSSDIYAKKTERGYMAALQVQGDIDSFLEIRFEFERMPTDKMLKDALLLRDIRFAFRLGDIKNVGFVCWECGHAVKHWLDVGGDLGIKFERLKEKYCGDC
jgi:hypothetical protein